MRETMLPRKRNPFRLHNIAVELSFYETHLTGSARDVLCKFIYYISEAHPKTECRGLFATFIIDNGDGTFTLHDENLRAFTESEFSADAFGCLQYIELGVFADQGLP
eukprot:UN05821